MQSSTNAHRSSAASRNLASALDSSSALSKNGFGILNSVASPAVETHVGMWYADAEGKESERRKQGKMRRKDRQLIKYDDKHHNTITGSSDESRTGRISVPTSMPSADKGGKDPLFKVRHFSSAL